ncbi:MAG: cytochrome c biogenesis protein ResB [Planctomycetota bacterium]|nr:cytochrome c biogenesis protein ResB [Planctomycetota bacterium]
MANAFARILKPLASLRLTVALLAMAMLLVFFGTLAQQHQGIWTVQKRYFHTLIIWGFGPPLPGGFLIGGMLLVNLLAAHATRFKLAWNRTGILLIHVGIILLLVGEIITGIFALETQMAVPQGKTVDYTFDVRRPEIAVVDTSGTNQDRVVTIPLALLRDGNVVRDANLPCEVLIEKFVANSRIAGPMQQGPGVLRLADREAGTNIGIVPLPDETDAQRVNMPAAFVSLRSGGERLGTWLVSLEFGPQPFEAGGKQYLISLRYRRHHVPYGIHLVKFTHKSYPGTDIPQEFSSQVEIVNPAQSEKREALISMNSPLRYDGKTFYQAGFADNDTTTILQVVENPGVWLPYASCALVGCGMLFHFLLMLGKFLARKAS